MNFRVERQLWNCGFQQVAGVDEVGRGALAGPLVAAAVVFPIDTSRRSAMGNAVASTVRDSKVMTLRQRENAFELISATADTGIGIVSNEEIDTFGLSAANRIAMERAVEDLPQRSDFLVLDATVLELDLPQVGFVDGDALVLSIAAASVAAKVTRDRMMELWDDEFGGYGFRKHRGYGTAMHMRALKRFGPCPLHRRSFSPVRAALDL